MMPYEFMQKQSLPYEAKIIHARAKAIEFYERMEGNVFCSVGGLWFLIILALNGGLKTLKYSLRTTSIYYLRLTLIYCSVNQWIAAMNLNTF